MKTRPSLAPDLPPDARGRTLRDLSHSRPRSFRQVIYPALDARISNVTPAYTVEHEDEV
jgi:hypothetical protein